MVPVLYYLSLFVNKRNIVSNAYKPFSDVSSQNCLEDYVRSTTIQY